MTDDVVDKSAPIPYTADELKAMLAEVENPAPEPVAASDGPEVPDGYTLVPTTPESWQATIDAANAAGKTVLYWGDHKNAVGVSN